MKLRAFGRAVCSALLLFPIAVAAGIIGSAALLKADTPVVEMQVDQPDWRDQYPTCVAYEDRERGMWPRFLLVQDADDPDAPIQRLGIERARELSQRQPPVGLRTVAVCE